MRKKIDNVNDKANAVSMDPVNPASEPKAVSRGDAAADEDVLELVHAVMHAYRSLQYRFLRDGPHGITHMDGKVLGYFARHPGATQRDLAEHSGRDKAQLARLIKGLRDRGLLDGEVDPDDRRNVRLAPTADGRAVQKTLQRQARRFGEQAVAGLDEAERAGLQALLRRVRDNLGG